MSIPEVFKTARGTRYLKNPGVVHMTETRFTERAGFREFLEGFGQGFELYADDLDDAIESGAASDGELAMQVAGQICYLSFGEKRTSFEENADYVVKIMDAAHGSVMHHSGFGFIIYGADRAFTHELVRHGTGVGVSQVSQRYVGPETLRFVMPFEDQQDPELCEKFESHIDAARVAYSDRIEDLRRVMPRTATETNTEWRKRIQSSARSILPNDTEAPLYWSANFRALTHVFSMRCSKYADVRIRRPMLKVLGVAQAVAPNVFGHFRRFRLPDGTWEAVSQYLKP